MPFEFHAPLLIDLTVDDGYMKHYVPIPADVAEALIGARVQGQLDGHGFRRSLHRRAGDEVCLKFGAGWLKDRALTPGELLAIQIEVDPDPDRVDIPQALEAAFDTAPDAALIWHSLTPGKQRTLTYGIERAKQPATKIRRAEKVIAELRRLG
jgi:hypothetical protein